MNLQGALSVELVGPDCVGLSQVLRGHVLPELGVHLLERVAAPGYHILKVGSSLQLTYFYPKFS